MSLEKPEIPQSKTPGDRSILFASNPAMQTVLLASALVGIVIYFLKISQTIPAGNILLSAIYSVAFLGILITAFLQNIPIRARYPVYLFFILLVGTTDLFFGGLTSDGLLFLFGFTVLTALFYRSRITLVIAAIPLGVMIFIGFGMVTGLIRPDPAQAILNSDSVYNWVLVGAVLYFGILASHAGVFQFIPKIVDSYFSQKEQTSKFEQDNLALTRAIDEASLTLQRRTSELGIASQIARNIALQQDPLNLIDNTLNSIRDQFGFYHAGLFLIDELQEYAVLKAATGDAGREMLNQNHRLKIGEQGIVGFVASQGTARIAADVGQDAVHFQNPLLPNTHSEMGLPLRLGSRIVGVLDVQSETESAFSQQDVNIIQTIADQLAVSIEHSRIVTELQRNLDEYKSRSRVLTQRDWAEFITNLRSPRSIRYTSKGLQKSTEESPISREAVSTGSTQVKTRRGKSSSTATVAVPIKLRDITIGVIELKISDPSEIPNIQNLVESTSSRLALSLENARLIEETQLRMEQEKMVSEITSRVRSSTTVNDILRQTALELGKSMGLTDVRVDLRTKSNPSSATENREKSE